MTHKRQRYIYFTASFIILIWVLMLPAGCREKKQVNKVDELNYTAGDTIEVSMKVRKPPPVDSFQLHLNNTLKFLECYKHCKDDMALRDQAQIRYQYTAK